MWCFKLYLWLLFYVVSLNVKNLDTDTVGPHGAQQTVRSEPILWG